MALTHRDPALPGPRVEVALLRAFVAVARLGGVGRAAKALGRTQPSVSARIATLEREWGTRLFLRTARGMPLSAEGARLLPRAEAILRELEELERSAGLPLAPARELRVGAGDAIGRVRLPLALARLLRESPGLDVRVREGPAAALVEALREGEIDLALVVRPAFQKRDPGIDLETVLESAVDVLGARGSLGRGRGPLPLASLAERRLVVLQPGSAFRRHLEAAFEDAGLSLRPAVEVGNLSLARRFVEAGLGVAAVPAVAFGPSDARGLERRRLAGVAPLRYERAIRAGAPLPAAATRLLALLK